MTKTAKPDIPMVDNRGWAPNSQPEVAPEHETVVTLGPVAIDNCNPSSRSATATVSGHRVVTAISWNIVATGSVTVIQVLRSILLARLLTPDDYGLVAMASLVTLAVGALTNVNATGSLIVRTDALADKRNIIDTIWTFDIMRQAAVTCLLLAAAYPSAIYFGDRRVTSVLLITAFIPFTNSLTNIGLTLLRKQIDFRTVGLHRLLSEAIMTALSIGLAFAIRNVWALIFAQMAGAMISVALSYWFHPYRPRLRYDRAALTASLSFARSMFVISLLTYVTLQFDQLIVGKYFGIAMLGAYSLAYRFAAMPVDILAEIVGNVMFPTFSGLMRSREFDRVEEALLGTFAGTAFVLAAVFLPMRLAGKEIISILYGNQWGQAVPLLKVFAFVGIFRGLTRVISPMLQGLGRADLDAKIKTIEAALFIPLSIILASQFGAVGAAWAGASTYLLAMTLRAIAASHLLPGSGKRLATVILIATVATTASYAIAVVAINAGAPALVGSVLFVTVLGITTYTFQPQVRQTVVSGISLRRSARYI